jgi:CHAT domain
MRRWAGAGVLAGLAGASALWIVSGPAAAQVTGDCESVVVNGNDVQTEFEAGRAIEVSADEPLVVEARTVGEVSFFTVTVQLPFIDAQEERRAELVPGTGWEGTVPVSDYTRYGVGLYRVTATAENCTATALINVVGRNPLTTVAGASAAAAVVGGISLLVVGVVRGVRGKGGLVSAVAGGALAGGGAAVLAQQFGVAPLDETSVVSWMAIPGAVGGLVQRGVRAIAARGAEVPSEGADVRPEPLPEAEPPREAEALPDAAPPSEGDAGAGAGGEPVEVGAGGEEVRDPPRSAFALLWCPDVVVAERAFELTLGLAEEATPGVTGGPLVRPATSIGPYTLTVQVVAAGFRLADPGSSWRQDLPVTADAPYPRTVLRLVAEPQAEPVRPGTIQAIFSSDGQTLGLAVRSLAVVQSEQLVGSASVGPQDSGTDFSVPTAPVAPDLTVRILFAESESSGRLLWTFETPHAGIDLPDAPVGSDIGSRADQFAKVELVDRVNLREGRPGFYQFLRGIGLQIADQVPPEFWELLRAVAARTEGAPTVLLLSQEPYIPWELALMEAPLLDAGAPPFLAAQTDVGRWVLGHRRPKLPPPVQVEVEKMAVLWGVYDRQEWRLLEAEDEAAKLQEAYAAASVNADVQSVIDCLEGTPEAELLHFAVHGVYNPAGAQEGLVLVDGQSLDPLQVKGSVLRGAPFVFINACQVGSGNQILGDYAGMAAAFLYAGASGVVAPLWSIADGVAKQIALRFYERTLIEGTPPSEVFRVERGAFREADEPVSGTYLAYQFFGHPSMKLSRRAP